MNGGILKVPAVKLNVKILNNEFGSFLFILGQSLDDAGFLGVFRLLLKTCVLEDLLVVTDVIGVR